MQLGTNVVGHYFLSILLLPALEAASASGEKARVVHTSSSTAYLAKEFLFDCINDGPERQKQNTRDMYYSSKLVSLSNWHIIRMLIEYHSRAMLCLLAPCQLVMATNW